MRVNRVRRDERGAVLVMVGVFSVVMFAMAAFVVDLGNQRQNRMQLSTATDAAALDVAQEWANAELDGTAAGFAGAGVGRWNCTSVARNIVRANNDGLDVDSVDCVAELEDHDWGVVTVAASEDVDYQFGGAMGATSGGTRATTSVKVSAAAKGGLRPFAVCADLPAVRDFISGATGPGDEVQVDTVKHLTPECGSASGNWGLLDLDGNGAKSVADLFADGYDRPVTKSAGPGVCEQTTPESCFSATPGAKWNAGPLQTALGFLEGPPGCAGGGPEFSVPTYEQVLDPTGKNAKFPLTGFLRVQLVCFTVGGSNLNSLTLKLVSYSENACCSAVSATNRVLEICDVGTIDGALGSDFESSCGTPSAVPPAVGDGCSVQPVTPAARDVSVTAAGLSEAALVVDVSVADASVCGDLRLKAVVQGTERPVPAPAPVRLGNVYRYTFPQGTDFGPGGTYLTLVVYEDDFVWDQSATLHTVVDPGVTQPDDACAITRSSVNPSTVTLKNNSDQTDSDVAWTVDFEWPSSCGTVQAVLHKVTDHAQTISIGSAPVSATMKFTLAAKTKIDPGTWRAYFYATGGQLISSGEAVIVKR